MPWQKVCPYLTIVFLNDEQPNPKGGKAVGGLVRLEAGGFLSGRGQEGWVVGRLLRSSWGLGLEFPKRLWVSGKWNLLQRTSLI